MKLLGLFLIFANFGILCFGGGNVLVPLYIEKLVYGEGLMTLQEFGTLLAISQMTPGPISINAATFFGFKSAGILGSLAATVGLVTPSFILMIVALHSLKRWKHSPIIKGLMWGVAPATIALMFVALVVFVEMSILDGKIPWDVPGDILSFKRPHFPNELHFSSVAFAITAAVVYLLCKTRISIMAIIFLCAIIGAVVFPFVSLQCR